MARAALKPSEVQSEMGQPWSRAKHMLDGGMVPSPNPQWHLHPHPHTHTQQLNSLQGHVESAAQRSKYPRQNYLRPAQNCCAAKGLAPP